MLTQSLLALAMLAQIRRIPPPVYFPVSPYVPATQLFDDYPVHVRILESRWSFSRGTYYGFGRGDILGSGQRGFDFTYECGEPFRFNEMHGEFYEGKWKKPDLKLELLLQRVGSDHISPCTLKTSLKPAPYQDSSATWLDPTPAPNTPNRPAFSGTPPHPASPASAHPD